MEIVLIEAVVASYGSTWLRCANSRDLAAVKIKDRFREQGCGEGAEELEVEGIDLSPVSGASRIFFRRAANNTKAEVHRLGSVMEQTNATIEVGPLDRYVPTPQPLVNATSSFSHTWTPPTNGSASQEERESADQTSDEGTTEPLESSQAAKRGRGRPKGSKNRKREPLVRVPAQVPTWPSV